MAGGFLAGAGSATLVSFFFFTQPAPSPMPLMPELPSLSEGEAADTAEVAAVERVEDFESEEESSDLSDSEISADLSEHIEPPQVVTVEAVPVESLVPPEVIEARRARRQAELQARREQERELSRQRLEFLDTVDPDFLSGEQVESHQIYAQNVARVEEIRAALIDQGSQMTSAERIELRREMRETQRMVEDASASERMLLLEAVARSMGLEGDDPASFADTVSRVISVTENPRRRPRRRSGPHSY